MAVPLSFGIVRPVRAPWIRLTRSMNLFSISRKGPFSVSVNGSSRSSHIVRASLHSSSVEQSEIIFIGTGTSEGIPRVSCLTNPIKTCPVCSKATDLGSKNRRLNTSLLLRFFSPSGKWNILIDAGKFFYHSALRWFPAYGVG